jgi:cephalosporin hydroxylase
MENNDPKDPVKIANMAKDSDLAEHARATFLGSCRYNYSYNFKWLGRPIIQYPQDMIAMQELIWDIKPDLIVETGIAHGGSLIFYASILELIGGPGKVLGIDIDIRPQNRAAIEAHAMFKRIQMIQGSAVDDQVAAQVRQVAQAHKTIMVVLDSYHSHDHVRQELELYAGLVTKGSYLVVFDTAVEDAPPELFSNRPWGKGNNPKTAVWDFLKTNQRFVIDREVENKLLLTVAPDGYLKCIKD